MITHYTTSILSLTVLSLSLLTPMAWAEDAAVPAATPAPVAPKNDGAERAEKVDEVVFSAPKQRNRPAAAMVSKPYTFGINLSAGYDSNILLENSDTPTATGAKGIAYTAGVRGNYKLVENRRGRLAVFGSAEFDGYPGNSIANLSRLGGGFTTGTSFGGFDPGLVVGYNHFSIDNRKAATALNVNAYIAKIFESNVSVLGVGSQYVEYSENDPITGTLYDVSYRHWFLFEPKRIARRIEVSVKAGKNRTHGDDEAYTAVVPAVAALYRIGDKPVAGTQDLSAKIQYEMRAYPEPQAGGEAEKQKILSLTAGYDYWLAPWLSAGLYAGLSKRNSNNDANVYDRQQGGIRASASW